MVQVDRRLATWKDNRESQSQWSPQLEWEAEVCEYVSFLADHTRSKNGPIALDNRIPIFGPRFIPPAYLHINKRNPTPEVLPETTYLKPLNVIHPFYYPGLVDTCPNCRVSGTKPDIEWNGWNHKGHREVHGISREETAIGPQLRCKVCAAKYSKHATGGNADSMSAGQYCFAVTSHLFWEGVEHWQYPRE
ncbi:hypothetical protein C8T65DRAFT_583608 [Cerioporus squamosus]|nr:hypothetical protein C8T65DRAFT_583608 [Cerioporus squamosus]